MDNSLSQIITKEQYDNRFTRESRVMPRDVSINESSMRQTDLDPMLISERDARKIVVKQYKNDILGVIRNDTYEPGFVSQSEHYIFNNCNATNYEYVREAANELYLEHYYDSQVLTGLLIMMGSLSYEEAEPQGQTMALGSLQHEDITVRDRAIQAFERWNSKKGLPILRSLHCDRLWLQRYVEKVIAYLERDGVD